MEKALLRNFKQGFDLSSMGLGGLEPPTSRLSGAAYSPQIPTLYRDFIDRLRDLPTSDTEKVGIGRD